MSLWWSGGGWGWCLWGGGPARGGDNCIPRSLSVIDSRDTNMMGALMMFTNRGKTTTSFHSAWEPHQASLIVGVVSYKLQSIAGSRQLPVTHPSHPHRPVTVSRPPGWGQEKRRKNYQRSVSIQMHLSSVFNTNPCHRKFFRNVLYYSYCTKVTPWVLLFPCTGSWLNNIFFWLLLLV